MGFTAEDRDAQIKLFHSAHDFRSKMSKSQAEASLGGRRNAIVTEREKPRPLCWKEDQKKRSENNM